MTARPEELQKLSPPKQLSINTEQSAEERSQHSGQLTDRAVPGRAAAAAASACPKLRFPMVMHILQEQY